MNISIIGTGYVGLVVGTGFAENGHSVVCTDCNEDLIQKLQNREIPFYEPGLEELFIRNIEEERLQFVSDIQAAVAGRLLIFICVNTPSESNGQLDMRNVFTVVEDVAKVLTGYAIIVLKSTCPVGTAEKIKEIISRYTQHPFDVVVNPEFLKEGAAVDDFLRPDRVVVGCEDVRVMEIMKELYAPFLRTGRPFISMDLRSAELTKFAVNAMLAARISLMNELANIAEGYGADIGRVRECVMADRRIGSTYLFPGIGFGGSCLPKDVRSAAYLGEKCGIACPVLKGIDETNKYQIERFVEKILSHYPQGLKNKNFAIWGASFKPRTDDLRGAPVHQVISSLLNEGAKISIYDPVSQSGLRKQYGDRIRVTSKMYDALDNAEGLAIVTEWREFHHPDFERMAQIMARKNIFDGRNIYTPKLMAEYGFSYISVGRMATGES